ncbi:hypothetical protein [Cohnella sp.]|uniref:hypothetical protein n=1 Tax=Cohnella sp. TaxID=1883426 RepID=UPI0037048285
MTDFYEESIPPDPEANEEEGEGETDWLALWALCIGNGVTDSEWPHMTIPKIRALMKARNKKEEFEIVLHGGEVKKKPKKAMYLSDVGFYAKARS